MHRSLLHRLTGMLVAALLLFSWTGEALGQHACPHHDSVPGAAAHAEDGDHAAHGMAHATSADQDQQAGQDHHKAPVAEPGTDPDHPGAPATVSQVDRDHDQADVATSGADQDYHGAPASGSEHQHDGCTCSGSCPSAVAEVFPPDPDAGVRVVPSWVRQARSEDASPVTLLLLPFFLPYGQAPPLLG